MRGAGFPPAPLGLDPRKDDPIVERPLEIACLLTLASTLVGCGAMPMTNAHRSEEALVEAVLDAVATGDGEALRGLLVSKEEYEILLWPSMPDGEYTPFEFFWGMMQANTRKGLGQLTNQYGGIRMELVSITPAEELEEYDDFTFHIGVQVVVRRPDTGDEGVLPSFDGLIEYKGRWKLLNYDEL